ncbi:MAG: hypothetical protein ACK5L5_05655 [Bacteroidales bacterium]
MKKLFTLCVSVLAILAFSMGSAKSQGGCDVFSNDTLYLCPRDLVAPIDLENQVVGINFEEGDAKGKWYQLPANAGIGKADTCNFPLSNSTELPGGMFMASNAIVGNSYTFVYRSTADQGCGITIGGVSVATITVVSNGDLVKKVCENKGPLNLLDILNKEVTVKIGGKNYQAADVTFTNMILDPASDELLEGSTVPSGMLDIDGKGGNTLYIKYEVTRRPSNGDKLSCMKGQLTFILYDANDEIVIPDETLTFCGKDEYADTDSIDLDDNVIGTLEGTWTKVGSSPMISSTGSVSMGAVKKYFIDNGKKAAQYTYKYVGNCSDETGTAFKTATISINFEDIDQPGFKNETKEFCNNANGVLDFDSWIGYQLPNGSWESKTAPDFSASITYANTLSLNLLPVGQHVFKWSYNSTSETDCTYPDSIYFTINIDKAPAQADVSRQFCANTPVTNYNLNNLLETTEGKWWYTKGGTGADGYKEITDAEAKAFNLKSFASVDGPVGQLAYTIGQETDACGADTVSVYLSFVKNIIINNRSKYFCIYSDDVKNINIGNILGSEFADGKWTYLSSISGNVTEIKDGNRTVNVILNASEDGAGTGEYTFTYTGTDCSIGGGQTQTATVTIIVGTELK